MGIFHFLYHVTTVALATIYYPCKFLILHIKPHLHGKARWMHYVERRHFLSPHNRGLALSPRWRLSEADSFTNLCLTAPTGTGKTTRFVIPNILRSTGSVVVTDPSGEIYRATSGHMAARGYRVQVVQPADITHSQCFNPMSRVHTAQGRMQLATTLAMNTASAAGDDKFWVTMARNLLTIAITAVSNHADPAHRHLGNVRMLLNSFGVEGEGIQDYMAQHCDSVTHAEYLAFCAQDSRVLSSILSTARAALDLWSDPNIAHLTSRDTLGIESLRKHPTIIYIIVPEHRIRYFSIVINLLYAACFEYCIAHSGRTAMPVYFFLDEFGNLGYINDFPTVATTLRKRHCSLNIILQEEAQLRAIYGKDGAQSIFAGGMGNKLFFGGLDYDAAQYVEHVLGSATEIDHGGSTDHMTRTLGTPLLSADQIRMLPAHKAILVSGRQPPALIAMPPYFKVPALKRLAAVPPLPIPETPEESLPLLRFGQKAPPSGSAPFALPRQEGFVPEFA